MNREKKKFLVVGRAGVDLYSNQSNLDLDQVTSFSRYVGGSAANIAVQLSRLGAPVKLITKISGDPWGKYIHRYLTQNKVVVSKDWVALPSRNSLAITEIKLSSSVVFYRHDPADLLLHPDDIDEKEVAQARGIIITGTALSRSPSREAVMLMIDFAKKHQTPIILDLDYRPDGFKYNYETYLYYKWAIEKSDIVIGTRDEFDEVIQYIIGKDKADAKKLKKKPAKKNLNWSDLELCKFFYSQQKLFIIKKGSKGSVVFQPDPISKSTKLSSKSLPENPKPTFTTQQGGVFKVKVKKNFGAGDSFAGTFCFHYFKSHPLSECLQKAAAAAALVVERDTCTEAMPTLQEINQFIKAKAYSI